MPQQGLPRSLFSPDLSLTAIAAMSSQELIEQDEENAPLLGEISHSNPLPKGQMFALLLLMTAEPLMSLSIMPYINEVCYLLV